MKLSEMDRLILENADLKLQLINKATKELVNQSKEVKQAGDVVIKKFCEENNLDATKISIDPNTGEVKLIESGTEV